MEIRFRFGGVIININMENDIEIESVFARFKDYQECAADLNVTVRWEWKDYIPPKVVATGRDLLHNYYVEEERCICETRSGPRGAIAGCCYRADLKDVDCYVNTDAYPYAPRKLDWILRALPMNTIFQKFEVLFMHAAQVAVGGKGILFTAPSGTGKTTQANLWQKYKKAKLICNDRTLIRETSEQWYTYGYPIDGSAPICSSEIYPLGCIVLLEQGKKNSVVHLSGIHAAAALMPQTVIDVWSVEAQAKEVELLLKMLQTIPVYRFSCTPDFEAVECLEHQLILDGVIENG